MAEPKKFIEHVQGKFVEEITLSEERDGVHNLDIRFQDKTEFHIRLDCRLVVEVVELRDWTKGEGTLIKKFV